MFDLLIRDCNIIDGTGRSGYRGDIAVTDDRISEIGPLSSVRARRTLDAEGLVAAPGFIDLHTHCDFTIHDFPEGSSMLRQGVTTLVGGNCGMSPFPLGERNLELMSEYTQFFGRSAPLLRSTAAEFLCRLEELPLGPNIVSLVGHNSLRSFVMGFEDKAASPEEIDAMCGLMAAAMGEGVAGLSSGLIYSPGCYSSTEELEQLVRLAGVHGGIYATHVRDEANGLLEAIGEAIEAAETAGTGLELSHHKAMGRRNWGLVQESLRMIDAARDRGVDVMLDVYPYVASSTTMASVLPKWAVSGGIGEMRRRLGETATRREIAEGMRAGVVGPRMLARPFEPDGIRIGAISDVRFKKYSGSSLSVAAAEYGPGDSIEFALDLLESVDQVPDITIFSMSETDVQRVMSHEACSIASDGWVLHPNSGGHPHPRSYGSFARTIRKYVREEKLLSLEAAVFKMSGLPAKRLGMRERGRLGKGLFADLVLLRPDAVRDRATFSSPHAFASGVDVVVVNGRVAAVDGLETGVAAGRVLRRNASNW